VLLECHEPIRQEDEDVVQRTRYDALHALRMRTEWCCSAAKPITKSLLAIATARAHVGVVAMMRRCKPLGEQHMTAQTQPTIEELIAMVSNLQADNTRLNNKLAEAAAQPARKISMKVSEKGALSLYGLGRFPTTLYRTQWERLLAPDQVKAILAFITTNEKLLTVKE